MAKGKAGATDNISDTIFTQKAWKKCAKILEETLYIQMGKEDVEYKLVTNLTLYLNETLKNRDKLKHH